MTKHGATAELALQNRTAIRLRFVVRKRTIGKQLVLLGKQFLLLLDYFLATRTSERKGEIKERERCWYPFLRNAALSLECRF